MDGCPRLGGDEADPAGEKWQRPFPGLIEQTLTRQFLFQLLERDLERADPFGLQVVEHHLILATRLVDRQAPPDDHLEAFLQGKPKTLCPRPEQHGPDLAALILEGEIQMPRGRGSQIGHFALHPDIGERLFQPVPDQEGQLGNGENLSRVRAHKSSGV